ncbi:MAG: DUF3368 domain-containing protein [Nitrososphaerales archaeon]
MGRVQSRGRASPETPTLVLNATPLIYLCKSGLARHLRALAVHYRLCTTREVYQEVYVKGMQKSVSEMDSLKELFEDNLVELLPEEQQRETNPKSDGKILELLKGSGLHTGEITVIQTAISLGGTAIVDDKRARNVARFIGVNLSGTANIVVALVKHGIIDKSEAKEGINRMIDEGWYCSTKDYVNIINSIEKA